jgi:hypothetical protein
MIGAHVVLHLGLCNPMLKLPVDATTKVHIALIDRLKRPHVDQDFSFKRYDDPTAHIEFDAPPGLYFMQISAPQFGCYASDWLFFIDQHNRTISEQLNAGPPTVPRPMLMDGTAPSSFLYLNPTYVLFDKTTQCNKPVPDPIPSHVVVENDPDSFYVWLYADQSLYARGPEILALQLQTATGEDHYIKLKTPFPQPWDGFPTEIQFNVTDSDIDYISTQPTGVLLCPKLFQTSAG